MLFHGLTLRNRSCLRGQQDSAWLFPFLICSPKSSGTCGFGRAATCTYRWVWQLLPATVWV